MTRGADKMTATLALKMVLEVADATVEQAAENDLGREVMNPLPAGQQPLILDEIRNILNDVAARFGIGPIYDPENEKLLDALAMAVGVENDRIWAGKVRDALGQSGYMIVKKDA